MILADTNCLLLLAGLDDNGEINNKKLDTFVSDKSVGISAISIFELLNNPRTKRKYSFIIQMVISKCKRINFLNTSFFNLYFGCDILNDLECKDLAEQERVKKEMSKAITDIFAFYYSNLLACAISAYFIIFSNFDDISNNNDGYFKEKIQANFDLLESKLKSFLSLQFKMMIQNYIFNEKTRKNLIESLYFGLVKEYADVYNKTVLELHKKDAISYEILFLRLISVTRRTKVEKLCSFGMGVGFKDISLFESLTKQLDSDDEKNSMKDYLTKIALTLAKNDDNEMISPYLNKLFESNVRSLLFEKAKFNDNDILDSLILDYIYYSHGSLPFEGLLTFDKKLINKAKAIYPSIKIYDAVYFK